MNLLTLEEAVGQNPYPGRGILVGETADGTHALAAYFIMGRSENSRNRIFVADHEGLRTQAFDPSKLSDPSLIIYSPVRVLGNDLIVTNGDQTDTIYENMKAGMTFEQSLRERKFEPDAPNYTPRISAVLHVEDGQFSYQMSILKSYEGDPSCSARYTFSYDFPVKGEGRFLHTYIGNGNPLPSFEGEPERVKIDGDLDSFAERLWGQLDHENKISLFVRYINIENGTYETRILNKYK